MLSSTKKKKQKKNLPTECWILQLNQYIILNYRSPDSRSFFIAAGSIQARQQETMWQNNVNTERKNDHIPLNVFYYLEIQLCCNDLVP